MTELEINKLVHVKIMNLCWHEPINVSRMLLKPNDKLCKKCGNFHSLHPSYTSSWADYGPMLEECMKKEWWFEFLNSVNRNWVHQYEIIPIIINPLLGSTAIAEFLKERKP